MMPVRREMPKIETEERLTWSSGVYVRDPRKETRPVVTRSDLRKARSWLRDKWRGLAPELVAWVGALVFLGVVAYRLALLLLE